MNQDKTAGSVLVLASTASKLKLKKKRHNWSEYRLDARLLRFLSSDCVGVMMKRFLTVEGPVFQSLSGAGNVVVHQKGVRVQSEWLNLQSECLFYLKRSGFSPASASPPVSLCECVCRRTNRGLQILSSDTQKSLCFFFFYSLKLKFRPELSVIGEEGPALDTALEGMLPCHRGWLGGRRDVSDPEEDRGCCGL